MEALLPEVAAFAVHISPALLAVIWAVFSPVRRVKRLLLLAAKVVVLTVIALFLFLYSLEILCDGSALKGYVRCSLIPVAVASHALSVYLLSMGAVGMWCIVTVVICIGAEIDAMRKRGLTK